MKFTSTHYLIPLMAIFLGMISQYSGLDIWLAGHFYDQQQHLWPYKNIWLTQNLLHVGGRDMIALLFVGLLVYFVMTLFVTRWQHWRSGMGYLLLASFTGLLIVGQLKSHTHMYSPWDLKAFGGPYLHIRLFDAVAQNSPVGNAFPAGHASGGYALLSIYFLLYQTSHRYRHYFLVIAMLLGIIFGIDQQIRGAHMLSHDLFTLAICWLSCMLWAYLFFGRGQSEKMRSSGAGQAI